MNMAVWRTLNKTFKASLLILTKLHNEADKTFGITNYLKNNIGSADATGHSKIFPYQLDSDFEELQRYRTRVNI